MITPPFLKSMHLEENYISMRVATAIEHIGDVDVRLEIHRSRDGALHVRWPDVVEVPLDVRMKVEPELLRCYIDDERLSNE